MDGAKNRERFCKGLFVAAAIVCIVAVIAIFAFLILKSIPAFHKIGFFRFLFGSDWNPVREDTYAGELVGRYGVLTMIVGTLFSTVGALLVGGTLGFFTAVFLAFFCPRRLRRALGSFINLLAGIPSVVYGFFGMKFLLPLLGELAPNGSGSGRLATSLILGIMILPTVVSLSKTSLEAVPKSCYEGALALGARHEQAVFRTVVPAAKSGVAASLILGVGRAVGETMAVVMVAGNAATIPDGLFASFRTLTANVVMEMGYAGEVQMGALIATGVVLLLFILVINLLFSLVTGPRENGRRRRGEKGNGAAVPSAVVSAAAPSVVESAAVPCAVVSAASASRLGAGLVTATTESSAGCGRRRPWQRIAEWRGVLAYRLRTSRLGAVASWVCGAGSAAALVLIVSFILVMGVPHLSAQLLFGPYTLTGPVTILPSIVATLMVVLVSIVIAIPLGVMTAIFLNEYTRKGNRLVRLLRGAVDILSGIPSIVYGLFGMLTFTVWFGGSGSILAGGCTVSIMLLPVVVRSTEESLKSVADSLREGSLALGAGKVRTIFKVVLPGALPGILSAVILSIGRVFSESAPFVFAMGGSLQGMPDGFLSGGTTLAVALYRLAGEGWHENEAYATACVLIFIVLLINLLAEWIGSRLNRKLQGETNAIRTRHPR